jgi:hypothetical protein
LSFTALAIIQLLSNVHSAFVLQLVYYVLPERSFIALAARADENYFFPAYSATNIEREETEEKRNKKGFSLKLHRTDMTTMMAVAFTKG